MLQRLKRTVPVSWFRLYHRFLSKIAAFWYGYPSEEMIVIGVTGTNGKTTTSYLIAKALEASGHPTGCTTTALFKIGEREWINDTKMTMLGRFQLQKLLRQMVREGCRYVVVETSSQGVVQNRHADINYDIAVFTNLTPEHIESHGGFENYKQAKLELFRHVARCPRKMLFGTRLQKTAVLNIGSEHAADFALANFDQVVWYSAGDAVATSNVLQAQQIEALADGTRCVVDGHTLYLHLPGIVNVENALAALAVCRVLGVSLSDAVTKLEGIKNVPGRFERIEEGQPWLVIIDYAVEPAAMAKLYETLATIPHQRILHVFGSCGGGRDVARRPLLGRLAGEKADIVIVTNEDPYDDDPRMIMEQIADGARQVGKREGESLFIIEDRREAIFEAMRQARVGDIVLMTGKGSEQAICVAHGKKVPWDERVVAREAIRSTQK